MLVSLGIRAAAIVLLMAVVASAQVEIPPAAPGGKVVLYPGDLAVLDHFEARRDLPCSVTPIAPVLGFDLQFHAGYRVRLPKREVLRVIVRVTPGSPRQEDLAADLQQGLANKGDVAPMYLSDRFAIAPGTEEVGWFQLDEGRYRVDLLLRDPAGRICSAHWQAASGRGLQSHHQARLAPRDDAPAAVKLLLNVSAPPGTPSDEQVAVLVSMLRAIAGDPRVGRVALVAFDVPGRRVLFHQPVASRIDFSGLSDALRERPSMLVDFRRLQQKDSDSAFLRELLEREVADCTGFDAMLFVGPGVSLRHPGKLGATAVCPVFFARLNAGAESDNLGSFVTKSLGGRVYQIARPGDWASAWEAIGTALAQRVSSRGSASACGDRSASETPAHSRASARGRRGRETASR